MITVSACSLLCCLGCNPSFLAAIGGQSVSTIDAGRGYVVILLINNTAFDVTAIVNVTKADGATVNWTLTAPAGDFGSIAQQCDIQAVEVQAITYVDTSSGTAQGGVVLFDPEDAQRIAGQNLKCGQVVAISVAGAPPAVAATIEAY